MMSPLHDAYYNPREREQVHYATFGRLTWAIHALHYMGDQGDYLTPPCEPYVDIQFITLHHVDGERPTPEQRERFDDWARSLDLQALQQRLADVEAGFR